MNKFATWTYLVWLLSIVSVVIAGQLSTTGAFPCDGGGDGVILVTNFTFRYEQGANSVSYKVEATSKATVSVIGEYK